jgi:hypothetical protein
MVTESKFFMIATAFPLYGTSLRGFLPDCGGSPEQPVSLFSLQ